MELVTDGAHFVSMLESFHEREALLVVEDEGTLQGWGVVKRYSERIGYRVACETSIYLHREHTGRGYGTALQRALMSKVRELDYHHIVAKIWASNTGSIRFHEKFGYEVVGIQKEVGYLDGKWRDVAILQCVLSDVAPYRPGIA
jgi:L-amino acid N-acyltransferase YncA